MFLQSANLNTAEGTTVVRIDDDILRDIHQTTGEVTRIGCLKRRIGQPLTGTVGRDEVLQDRKSLFEVGEDRVFDNFAPSCGGLLRLGHKTSHTGKLANLLLRTTGSGVEHHIYRVEPLSVFTDTLHCQVCKASVGRSPYVDHLVITLVIGDKTHVIVGNDPLYLLVGIGDHVLFFLRNDDVTQGEGEPTLEGKLVSHGLDIIEELGCTWNTGFLQYVTDDITE